MRKKSFLFYFIHPAKFHAFRVTINNLKEKGYDVDVWIIKKDMLEDLVKDEGWNYKNIFPEGRRIKNLHTYLNAGINTFRTIYRLINETKGEKYSLCITDDLYTIVGRLLNIPTIFFTDDDISAVPESVILISTADFILAPSVCYMGKYEYKKIGYYGYKSLAHLHPNVFTPDKNILNREIIKKPYYFFRLVSATSTHDVGKKGLGDNILSLLVEKLSRKGNIVINTERAIPDEFKEFILPYNKKDVKHYIAFADIFISDSTTMCAEAAVLGTPSIEIDDWFSDFRQYNDFNSKYNLLFGYKPDDVEGISKKIDELLSMGDFLKSEYQRRRQNLLNDNIDLSSFMIWLFEDFPESINVFFKNPNYQVKFK